MIQNVSIPAALVAGLVSFLSPCVLPLVPPYLIYLTGATIEHVTNEESVSSSKHAVMISAGLFVLGFDQGHDAVLVAEVEVAVGVDDRRRLAA